MAVIPQTPRTSVGLRPPGLPTRLLPWTRWGPQAVPDPSSTHAPLTTNPESASDYLFVHKVLKLKKYLVIYFNDKIVVDSMDFCNKIDHERTLKEIIHHTSNYNLSTIQFTMSLLLF